MYNLGKIDNSIFGSVEKLLKIRDVIRSFVQTPSEDISQELIDSVSSLELIIEHLKEEIVIATQVVVEFSKEEKTENKEEQVVEKGKG